MGEEGRLITIIKAHDTSHYEKSLFGEGYCVSSGPITWLSSLKRRASYAVAILEMEKSKKGKSFGSILTLSYIR